jgi:hypothetical protein
MESMHEKRIDKLEEWKEGKPGIPGIEGRVLAIEGKLKDNGELGIMTKVAEMWERHTTSEAMETKKKESGSIKLLIALAFLSFIGQIITMIG